MNSYKTQCPECSGDNFYVTPSNGVGYCFNCAYAERDGSRTREKPVQSPHVDIYRELYSEVARYYHSCLQPEHVVYLHERGITDDTIQRMKIGYCPTDIHLLYKHPLSDDSGLTLNAKPALAGRIVFPYFLHDMIVDLRGRQYDIDSDKKYLSLYKSSVYRGANFAYNVNTTADDIIITEGEIKAIVPSQEGYAVHGLPGILSRRITAIKPYKRAIALFDNQKQHIKDVHRAIMRLASRIDNMYVATLPLRGDDKQDIDSYILKYGIGAFQTVIRNAIDIEGWKNLHGYTWQRQMY